MEREWFMEFGYEHTSTTDIEGTGCPKEVVAAEIISKSYEIMLTSRRLGVRKSVKVLRI